ncbi:histidine phosphatase superfamily [Crucibulum laeve]|uniref:Histidine phosphatase superfamily n=1 Tax=Crucibulum laeve TaxID=68775 RepID=A0A5C3MID7_9AGAR|nr:histidine phosphatase superfamily [Crucibulum laeve]
MASTDSTESRNNALLGVILLIRHGDREGFYQSPVTYTPSNTAITPLGNKLRGIYINPSSPTRIPGINSDVVNDAQLLIRADAGGEGGVIFNSAVSLLQGLFPGTRDYNTTLANGTNIVGPLGGYQYIPIESVEPDNDVSLEGWTSCGPFADATAAFYNSTQFKQKAIQAAPFLRALPPFLDGRPVTLENMIFDFMNVQSIHNATFLHNLPPTFLAQARALADFHEYGVFSSPSLSGIGNIAGQTILPSILNGIHRITNASDPLKFVYEAISYKPFISLFNMTGAAQANPELAGIVNYAAALALEVRQSNSGPVLRLKFKNGTIDNDFKTFNFLGRSGDVPISVFINRLAPVAINSTSAWCKVCNNNKDRGCDEITAVYNYAGPGPWTQRQAIGPVGAGFLGAGTTLVAVVATALLLSFLGLLSFGKRSVKPSQNMRERESDEDSVNSIRKL